LVLRFGLYIFVSFDLASNNFPLTTHHGVGFNYQSVCLRTASNERYGTWFPGN